MSYPPYNPNEQGMYPPPQHATTPLSYPIYPGSAAPPPSGYPQSMPMPSSNPYPSYSPQPGFPMSSQPSPYPPQSSPYPPQSSPYPQPSQYPSQPSSGPYPSHPSSGPYPSQPSSGPYPSQPSSGPYPSQPTPSPYPSHPTSSPYPSHSTASPYPSQAAPSPYPSQPTSSPYPSQPGYPSGQSAYPKQPSPTPHGAGNMHGHGGNSYSNSNVPYSNSGQTQQPAKKGNPTIHPANPFNPREDAEILRKAMKGFGTDEKAIINVLCNRTNVQRQEIALQFKTLYGKDLIKDLKSELSGNFEDLIVLMMTPISYVLAKELHDAVSGIGTDEETIIEILCTATNNDIHLLRNAYSQLFGRSMEDDLAGDTSGSFRRLLVSLTQGNRSENYYIDPAAAQSDAQALLRAGELQLGTDESTFNAILCSRSYPQLRQVFEEYHHITGHDFTKAIENEFSGDIQDGLLAIVKSVRNRPDYFAERLYKSMKGFGTKDRTLQRICAIRCEIDMGDIKNCFSAKYGQSLEDFIKADCSGDYKKALTALVA